MPDTDSTNKLQCTVVTPEATALDAAASFVVLTLFDGEIGIAPNHSPLIGRLGFGEMRVNSGGQTSRFYVDGGFVQVADDAVSVLTNRLIPAAELDADAINQTLDEAVNKPAQTPELMAIRDRAVEQARGQLRVARGR